MKNQRDGGRARMSTTHLCYDGGDPIPHNGPARMALPVVQMLNLERPICLAPDRTNWQDNSRAFNDYRKRWAIERLFGGAKTRGLNLEVIRIHRLALA